MNTYVCIKKNWWENKFTSPTLLELFENLLALMKPSPACVYIYIYKYTKKLRENCKIKLPVQHYLSCLNTCLH